MSTNKTTTREQLIRSIVKESKVDMDSVRLAYNCLEGKVQKLLAETTPEQDVKVKLFEGITIEGKYIPETVKINNLTGKEITYKAKIKPTVKVSRRYGEKLNEI